MKHPVAALALALVAAACADAAPTTSPTATAPPTTQPAPVTATSGSPTTTTAPVTAPPSTAPAPTTTVTAPSSTVPATVPDLDDVRLALEPAGSGLGRPVFLTAPPGDSRLFVVDQAGRVRIVEAGVVRGRPFLDLSDLVRFDGEQGLLGLAFHPDYPGDPRFFVNYTDTEGTTRVVSYRVSADPDRADAGSATEVLAVPQPARNHNGGMIAFGPDGYLYVGMGDGGGSGDRFGHGQRPDTLLGALLRIDVNGATPYAVPADNPFASGTGGAPEVWAYGLRNPWRFSFDGTDLYIADVGQNRFEEIHLTGTASGGANFGWPIMEGVECFEPATGCRTAGLELPIHTYAHGPGCSVTGGYVYRGAALPALAGHYFYSDFCSSRISSFRVVDGVAVDHREWPELGPVPVVTSFGVDGAGELYVVGGRGSIFKIVSG